MTEKKEQHLDLAGPSRAPSPCPYPLNYEPLLSSLPERKRIYQKEFSFLGKVMMAPLWVSSMTGGTGQAKSINENLARSCGEFGLGMGLGSCRPLLSSLKSLSDFQVRPFIGPNFPLMGNIGIAQVESLLKESATDKLDHLVELLQLDGFFVHINPLQEWFQEEGDPLERPPLESLQDFLEKVPFPVAIKEVGQGFGPESLKAALQLPLAAIEFGAFGGTNFSLLEIKRRYEEHPLAALASVGHTPEEMVGSVNTLLKTLGPKALCREFIISGGVSSFLHGHSLIHSLRSKAVYGQGYALLSEARGPYEVLRKHIQNHLVGLELATRFLRPKCSEKAAL